MHKKINNQKMTASKLISAASPVSVVPVDAPPNKDVDDISLLDSSVVTGSSDEHSLDREQEPWVCPASAKSLRTTNPIRAIVDPIVANIQTGEQRGDGKDLISLAVSN